MTIQEFLSRLEGVHGGNGQWSACCPAHEDRHQSLSVRAGQDGRILLKCHAGCTAGEVAGALGLTMRDLFPAITPGQAFSPAQRGPEAAGNPPAAVSPAGGKRPARGQRGAVVATYTYTDAAGQLLAQKLRYENKSFCWRRPDGKGGWIWNRDGLPPLLYMPADKPGGVFVVEGEKDVDNLGRLGFTAASGPDGAGPGKWRPEHSERLRGRDVAVIQDNDPPGREYAAGVCATLYSVAHRVKLLDLSTIWPEIPEHGDASDLIEAKGAAEATRLLEQLAGSAPDWTPAQANAEYQTRRASGAGMALDWDGSPETPGGQQGSAQDTGFAPFEPFEPSGSPQLPDFPVEALPEPVRSYAQAVAECLQVPVDMPAAVLLAVFALASQGLFKINPKPGWAEPLNLYLVVVAPPSDRKSPVLKEICYPVYRFTSEENARRTPEIRAYQTKAKLLSKQLENLINKAGRPAKGTASEQARAEARYMEQQIEDKQEELADLEEVKAFRLLADDVTPEALTSLLADNGGRLGVMSAEGGLFRILSGLYSSKEANIDTFLKAYSGDYIMVDRKGRPSESIPDPALTMLLMIQPQVLHEIMENREFSGRGLLARYLYSIPRSLVGHRAYTTRPIPPETRAAYNSRLVELLALQAQRGRECGTIRLTEDAERESEAFHEWLEPQLVDDLEDIEAWAGKFHGQVARIAGVLHCIKNGPDAGAELLSVSTMREAVRIGRYFLEHAQAAFRLMGASESQTVKEAKYILKRLQSTGNAEISRGDAFHLCKGRLSTAEAMQPGLDELAHRGYVRIEKTKSGGRGRPAEKIILNPYTQIH